STQSAKRTSRLRLITAAGLIAFLVGATFLNAPDTRPAQAAEPIPGCSELVVNGSFETPGVAWSIIPGSPQAMYTNQRAWEDGGATSMLAGNIAAPNVEGASTFEQTLALPANPTSLVLSFRYLGVIDAAPGDGDMQYVDLLDAATNAPLERLMQAVNGDNFWQLSQQDLTSFGGRTVKLVFGVGNNGADGRIAMYVDAVSVLYCPGGSAVVPATPTSIMPTMAPAQPTPSVTLFPVDPTWYPTLPAPSPGVPTLWPTPIPTFVPTPWPTTWPTPLPTWPTLWPTPLPSPWPTQWPTPWPTPIPTTLPPQGGCSDILLNGSFEQSGAWEFGRSPIPGTIVGSFNAALGARAAQLGNPSGYRPDVESFSSVRQLVTIPAGTGGAQLRWWAVFRSQEAFAESIAIGADRQELILLNPDLSTREVLFRIRRIDGAIQQVSTDLTRFAGQSVYIYFNVFNDGNGLSTWMLLDGVQLCVSNVPIQPFGTQLGAPAPQGAVAAAPAAQQPSAATAQVSALGSVLVPRQGNDAPDGLVIPTSTVIPQLATPTPVPFANPEGAPPPDTQGESQGAGVVPSDQAQSATVLLESAATDAQNNGPGPAAIAVTLGAILLAVGVLIAGVVRALNGVRP
ncbi:MAG: hypothetical protein ACRC1H_14305, partial [Caldilineaceae bacterium]